MQELDIKALSKFARALVARGQAQADELSSPFDSPIPLDNTPDALRAALIAQAERVAELRARFSAEISVLMATLDRLEVEAAQRNGEIARVKADHHELLAEMARLRSDMKELGDAIVGRLIAEFDKRAAR